MCNRVYTDGHDVWWAKFPTTTKLSFPNGEREKEEPDNQSLIKRKKYLVPQTLIFLSFDPDMTVRHTLWGTILGGYFMWVSIYGINQTQVQRYLTVPKESMAVK